MPSTLANNVFSSSGLRMSLRVQKRAAGYEEVEDKNHKRKQQRAAQVALRSLSQGDDIQVYDAPQ